MVRLNALFPTAGTGTALQRGSETGASARGRLKAQKAVAKLEFVRQRLQRLKCGSFISEQPIEIRGMRKIDVPRVDDLRLAFVDLQGAELTVAAQALVNSGCCSLIKRASSNSAPISPAVWNQVMRRDWRSMAASSGVRRWDNTRLRMLTLLPM